MSEAHSNSLIADARLILGYAVRAGKLQNDDLPVSIQALEQDESAQNIIRLQNAMNAVVGHIVPMTLVDLRAGRNPFDPRNVHSRSRWQIGLALTTLALIAIIAYYQYLVQRQESALRSYKEVVEARGSERIYEVRKLAQQGNALAKDSCQADTYQKARHELKQLADRSVVATTTISQLSLSSAWPFVDSIAEIASQFSGSSIVPNANAAALAVSQAASQAASQTATEFKDPCEATHSFIPSGYPDWLRSVVSDSVDEFCFANKLSVDSLSPSDPIRGASGSHFGPRATEFDPVAKVEQRLMVQTGWLLPFLYGLLGACVYVMRRLLFDTKAAVVENVVIVLRLALGALAGVAVGWFAMPTTGMQTITASSLPYAAAFLAGFSIDILFAMLDRFNRAILDKAHASAN